MELQKIKNAEAPADCLEFAHPINIRTGLKKIPPPIFSKPATKPKTAPNNKPLISGSSLLSFFSNLCEFNLLIHSVIIGMTAFTNIVTREDSRLSGGLRNSG